MATELSNNKSNGTTTTTTTTYLTLPGTRNHNGTTPRVWFVRSITTYLVKCHPLGM